MTSILATEPPTPAPLPLKLPPFFAAPANTARIADYFRKRNANSSMHARNLIPTVAS